jgi:hypothetical protein
MSAIAAITLNDGATAPVAHTFSPVRIDPNGVAIWADRSGGIAIGYPTVNFSMRAPSKTTRNYKLTAKVDLPILEVTSPSTSTGIQPAPTLSYNISANVEMIIPERSTLQNRKDAVAYLKNYLASSVITAAVNDFESVY